MELLQKYGYSLIFLTISLEQIGLPIPAAPVLIIAGALSAGGMLSLPAVLICAIIGSFLGDLIWYVIGKKNGRGVLKLLCRLSLSPDSCVRKTETSFLRHGMNSLLYSKFVPGLNTIASPMAGMLHTRFFSFFWRDLAGIFFYCGALVLTGFIFERRVFEVTAILEEVGKSIFALILAVIFAYVLFKFLRLKYLQRRLYKVRITPEELYHLMQEGEFLTLVDLRSDILDIAQKLPGALKIPPAEIDQHVSKLDRERWIVMYCT